MFVTSGENIDYKEEDRSIIILKFKQKSTTRNMFLKHKSMATSFKFLVFLGNGFFIETAWTLLYELDVDTQFKLKYTTQSVC